MFRENLIKNFSFQHNKKNLINDYIYERFEKNKNIKKLLKSKSFIIDRLIKKAWKDNNLDNKEASLIAVGGYGRSELFPFSDIDILILISDYDDETLLKNIEKFIADIWHFKTSVGHSVRTQKECINAMNSDLTIYTNLLESRWICGNTEQYESLKKIFLIITSGQIKIFYLPRKRNKKKDIENTQIQAIFWNQI